jgi:ADP-L-glycero-D-manno-heptose 6-epimerase
VCGGDLAPGSNPGLSAIVSGLTQEVDDTMERVLITGGAGFIGSNLALELERRDPDVRVTIIDDFRSGAASNLIGLRGDLVAEDLATMDVRERLRPGEFQQIFHLASITDTTVTDARRVVHDNVEGFRRIAEYAARSRTPLVYASSAAVYGICGSERMAEDRAVRPANVYGFSKALMENLARRLLADVPGLRVVGLRYFNVYGPGESHKGAAASMIYQLAAQIRGGRRPRLFEYGEQRRDFVYIRDAVEATLLAARAGHSGVYNVASGRATSFNRVVELLNRALGTDATPDYFKNPYAFYQPHTEADLGRATSLLGYVPRYPIERGVTEYVKELIDAAAPGSAT